MLACLEILLDVSCSPNFSGAKDRILYTSCSRYMCTELPGGFHSRKIRWNGVSREGLLSTPFRSVFFWCIAYCMGNRTILGDFDMDLLIC